MGIRPPASPASGVDAPTSGLIGDRPSAAGFGAGWYFASDENGGTMYFSDGSSWEQVGPGVSHRHSGDVIMTADPRTHHAAISVGSANRGHYMRAYGSGDISKLGVYVGTQSGNMCVAVYSNTGSGRSARPNTRKATSGSVAVPAGSAWGEISLGATVTVDEGDWLFLSADNTTATFRSTQSSAALVSDAMKGFGGYEAAAMPGPATATATPTWDFASSFIIVGVE